MVGLAISPEDEANHVLSLLIYHFCHTTVYREWLLPYGKDRTDG